MNIPEVRVAGLSEGASIMHAITIGFVNDPVARYMWSDPEAYLTMMPKLAMAYGGKALDHASAYTIGNYSGAALWLPPGVQPDEEQFNPIFESIVEEKQAELGEALERLGAFHPQEPHWHLAMIAVDAYQQGQGFGSILMKHAINRCDEDGKMAYLESSNPRNISIYERYGFEVVGEVKVGGCPVFTPMIRPAS
jgi:GNAT superfamily N-acetyltransferase